MPTEIGNLINLQKLYLTCNKLQSLPAEIDNLYNLQELDLINNKLQSLPVEILKLKNKVKIDETSYDINNLNIDNEMLIFSKLSIKISNLPLNTKEIWLNFDIKKDLIKLPFNCMIKYY